MVNEYFQIIDYGGTFYYYLFEFANFSFLGLFALYIYKIQLININSFMGWLVIFFSPLLFNYFLISPYSFGDQFLYSGETFLLKANGESFFQTDHVDFAGKILGAVPLPNFMTVTSVAFSNKLLLFLTFLWFKRYFVNENQVFLFFLIPSLVLYSSLALRDTMIIIFSILFLISLLKDKYLFAIILLYPIFILKIQMFLFLSLYFIGRIIFRAHKSYVLAGFFISFLLLGSLILEDQVLLLINTYRWGFAAENFSLDNGYSSYVAWNLYGDDIAASLEIFSIPEAVLKSIINLPKFLLLPMPWNWSNPFHIVQTFESIFLVYLFGYLAIREKAYENNEFILLLIILLFGLMLYSLIMANEGTFVRYRFTLFYPFLLALFYIIQNKESFSKSIK
ncbi:hypothetical protein OAS63_02300 [Gammaproteobacteria bacterium]|nr:hypothetical protein [Gammaproteobacteria bacterium]